MNVVSGGTPADRLARALAGAAVPEQFRRAFHLDPPGSASRSVVAGPAGRHVDARAADATSTRRPSTRSRSRWTTATDRGLGRARAGRIAAGSVQLTVWLAARQDPAYAGAGEVRRRPGRCPARPRSHRCGPSGRQARPAAVSPADPALEYRTRTTTPPPFWQRPRAIGIWPASGILAGAGLAHSGTGPGPRRRRADGAATPAGGATLSPAEAERLAPVLGFNAETLWQPTRLHRRAVGGGSRPRAGARFRP